MHRPCWCHYCDDGLLEARSFSIHLHDGQQLNRFLCGIGLEVVKGCLLVRVKGREKPRDSMTRGQPFLKVGTGQSMAISVYMFDLNKRVPAEPD